MSRKHCSSHVGQPVGNRRELHIGTRNAVAEIEQHLGDAAHADAADADKVYALELGKHWREKSLGYRVPPGTPATRAARDAIRAAASGWAKHRAASDIFASRGRSRNIVVISFSSRSLVSSDCGSNRAAPASASVAALRVW